MPPNISKQEDVLIVRNKKTNSTTDEDYLPPREYKLVWRNIFLYVVLHTSAIYGFYLMNFAGKWSTLIWGEFHHSINTQAADLHNRVLALLLYKLGCVGVTAGAHRLWSHRAYKAKTPLKIILMLLQTLAFQVSIDYCKKEGFQIEFQG